MKPSTDRGLRKVGRDVFQALIALLAGGGAAGVIALVGGSLNPAWAVLFAFAAKLLVTYAQNSLETSGKIPVLLPAPGLVTTTAGGAVAKAVGTVDTVTEGAGQVVGEVVDTAGQVVGGIAGAVGGLTGGGA